MASLLMPLFQNNMLSKSSSGGLMNNSLNASLLAAAGIDARLLSQMNASYSQQPTAKARESPKPKPEPETKESQAQRQAAAKLALRKQLEKTLLQVLLLIIIVLINLAFQIPPPKPPPPEMHFIPNPANTEFIYLTGLEECVNRILNLDAVTPTMPTPFICSQCSTDFTPTWKWDKAAKGKTTESDGGGNQGKIMACPCTSLRDALWPTIVENVRPCEVAFPGSGFPKMFGRDRLNCEKLHRRIDDRRKD